MKKIAMAALLLIAGHAALGQAETDTAAMIVDRYLKALNYASISDKQMLYIESSIYDFEDRKDTVWMKRWYVAPHHYRTELWYRGELQLGFYTDGVSKAKRYDPEYKQWREVTLSTYYDWAQGYDFHGPLYNWRNNGSELQYVGETEVGGVKVQQVRVRAPKMFERDYMFETNDGLLFYVKEYPKTYGGEELIQDSQVDWRAFTQYIHEGEMMFPYTESYKKDGRVTVINHRYSMQAKDMKKFE